jgi:hypothetical protein
MRNIENMKRISKKVVIKTSFALLLALITLSACGGIQDRLWLMPPGWSRAQYVTQARNSDGAPLVLDEQGNMYIFLMADGSDGNFQPAVFCLSRQLELIWEARVEETYSQADDPRILYQDGKLFLFWRAGYMVYTTKMDLSGEFVSAVRQVGTGVNVGSYEVAQGPDGNLAFWFAGDSRDPGVYILSMDDPKASPDVIDPSGIRPKLQYDAEGNLHAIWAYYPGGYEHPLFYYAFYPDGKVKAGEETIVQELVIGPTTQLTGPWMGLDGENVYVFWSIYIRTGMSAGDVRTEFVSFPYGQGAMMPEVPFGIPRAYNLSYETSREELKAGSRFPLSPGYRGATGMSDISANQKPSDELAVAFHAQVQYRWRKQRAQISAAYFDDQAIDSYQLISFTSTESRAPTLLSDQDGYLYLTWMERTSLPGFSVYVASTAPDLVTELVDLRSKDVWAIIGDTAFGMLVGAVLSPFAAAIWMIVPMVLIALTGKLRPGHHRLIGIIGTLVTLGLALASFWVAKFATLSSMANFVPFSPWIPIMPQMWETPLRIGIPILIFLVSVLVAWNYTYRRNNEAPLYFMLIYIALDALMTMAVYGLLIYDAV